MIWTAIFTDRTVKVFSTGYNCANEAKEYAREICASPLFALIKGNHSEVEFF